MFSKYMTAFSSTVNTPSTFRTISFTALQSRGAPRLSNVTSDREEEFVAKQKAFRARLAEQSKSGA